MPKLSTSLRTRRQKIGQGVAVQRLQKRERRLAKCPAQHAASFDPAESGFGEASHHGEVLFRVAHDRPDANFRAGGRANLIPPPLPRIVTR